MKIRLISKCLVIFSSVMLVFMAAPARSEGWKLVFNDEFDGAELDTSKWATRYIYSNEKLDFLNDEKQRYRENGNHVLGDGTLKLVARKVNDGFESGMIRSRQTFYYGYFEARVLFPKGKGIWPAFWLGADYDSYGKLFWPPEIDIFEYAVNGKDDTESMVHSAASSFPKGAAPQYLFSDPDFNLRGQTYHSKRPLNEDWHTFGLVWAPDKISVFLDGKRIYTRAYLWLKNDGTLGAPAHVLLNFAIGGKWAGRYGIDEDRYPQAFSVDYVRVCQFTKGGDGTSSCGASNVTPDPKTYGYESEIDDLAKPILKDVKLGSSAAGGAGVESGSASIGDTLMIDSRWTLPSKSPAQMRLALSLISRVTQKRFAQASYDFAPSENQSGQFDHKFSIIIPANVPEGDYSVEGSLYALTQVDDRPAPPQKVPVTCDTSSSKRIKSLDCDLGKIAIRK